MPRGKGCNTAITNYTWNENNDNVMSGLNSVRSRADMCLKAVIN